MKKRAIRGLVLIGFIAPVVVVYGQSWWERILPRKSPQVLESSQLGPAPLDVHPDVASLQDSFANVADLVKPAVVNIAAVQITKVQNDPYQFYYGDPNEFFYRFFGEQPRRQQPREHRSEGTGSGVLIDPDGYILTNNHVVQGADQLTVTLSNNKSFKGQVVGTDPRSDLAVIQIKSPNPLPYIRMGDSSQIRIGDWVLAFGSPFGLEQTMTAGIISAIRQSLNIEGKVFSHLIQTDAAINRGNSGGPLVNLKGEIIGVNTAIYAPTGVFSGIGFAIPINQAKNILKDLIEKGYVERSWMGVEIAEVDDVLAEQFGLATPHGALVNNVVPNSPADKAGVERGDVIVSFDGQKIENVSALQDIVSRTEPQKTVDVEVFRNKKSKKLRLTTAVMPTEARRGEPSSRQKDAMGSSRTEWLGAVFSNHDQGGVVVVEIPPQSVARETGLQEGDVIRSVNQNTVDNVDDLKKLSEKIKLKDGVVFDVNRKGRSFYLSFKSLQ